MHCIQVLTVLACVSKEGPGTVAGEGVPKICALAIGVTRIWVALLRARTAALYIGQLGILIQIGLVVLVGKDPFAIDDDILHAAHIAGGLMRQMV